MDDNGKRCSQNRCRDNWNGITPTPEYRTMRGSARSRSKKTITTMTMLASWEMTFAAIRKEAFIPDSCSARRHSDKDRWITAGRSALDCNIFLAATHRSQSPRR